MGGPNDDDTRRLARRILRLAAPAASARGPRWRPGGHHTPHPPGGGPPPGPPRGGAAIPVGQDGGPAASVCVGHARGRAAGRRHPHGRRGPAYIRGQQRARARPGEGAGIMKFQDRVLRFVGFPPMAHRPPLRGRFWLYCTAAYLMPVFAQGAAPRDPGLYDGLVWLVTVAPAFLLSLHYGLKGAVAGLLMGTVLFLVVQAVLAVNYTPDDWRITVPIYVAYGTLAISVGWLSEQLHEYYERALASE